MEIGRFHDHRTGEPQRRELRQEMDDSRRLIEDRADAVTTASSPTGFFNARFAVPGTPAITPCATDVSVFSRREKIRSDPALASSRQSIRTRGWCRAIAHSSIACDVASGAAA